MLNRLRLRSVLKYAGAYIAWVIGSGFATGQEILQFFSSYGERSLGVLAINLIGFTALGAILLSVGFDHKDSQDFNHYEHYCGKWIGKAYRIVIPVTLALLISVLISAAGATVQQYFGLNPVLGSGIMAILILAVYLAGFEKMVRIVSGISPFVIVFTVFVGVVTLFRDGNTLFETETFATLEQAHAAPHWWLSALLYLSLNFICGSTYYTALGRAADTRENAVAGVLVGAAAILITLATMNYAILSNAREIASYQVPTLFLARKISTVFAALFSVILLMGMFSSCATTVWSFCSECFAKDPRKNRIFSVIVVCLCTMLGFIPFGNLMSVVYPLIGYAGLIYMAAVLWKGITIRANRRRNTNEV